MPRVRQNPTKNQPRGVTKAPLAPPPVLPLDDGTLTTPVTLAMIQALIPLRLRAIEETLLAEVEALAGPRYAREDERSAVVRWGTQRGSIYLADQKLPIPVPRVRDGRARREVPLATYAALQRPRAQDVGLFRRVLGGLSYRELRLLQERRLDDAEWLVLVPDGKTFAGDQLVVALGVTATGENRILGLVQTASENKRVIASFLRELGERGFPLEQPLLVVLDGAKQDEPIWRRKLQAAWAHPAYADAKRALDRLHRELRLQNESASASLAEGLEETLTLHRLGVFPELGVRFKTTNLIESVMARLEAKTQRVTRWHTSDQKLRRCAAALWATERQFRRVKHHRHLPLLRHALQHMFFLRTLAAAQAASSAGSPVFQLQTRHPANTVRMLRRGGRRWTNWDQRDPTEGRLPGMGSWLRFSVRQCLRG